MNDREWFSLGLLGLVLLAFLFIGGVGMPMMWMGGPMMGGWTGSGGWWWSPVFVFGSVLLVGLGIYLLVRDSRTSGRAESDRALTIARERYAQGEITQKEFKKIEEDLS